MSKHIWQILFTSLGLLALSSSLFSQTGKRPTIDEMLNKAAERREAYLREFENLLSVETKSFEVFDDAGQVKKKRSVKSTFIIYRLSQDQDVASEFRNVISVDGAPTQNADRRAEDFFVKVLKANSAAAAVKRVSEESARYDLGIALNGFTLFQAVALDATLRPFFEFTVELNNALPRPDRYVISFRQTKPCPFINVNTRYDRAGVTPMVSYYLGLETNVDYHERIAGKLTIDARTFQLLNEERAISVQPAGFPSPVVLTKDDFTFQKSDFGILTPTRIFHLQYKLRAKDHTSVKQGSVLFEYEKFTKPNVEVNASAQPKVGD